MSSTDQPETVAALDIKQQDAAAKTLAANLQPNNKFSSININNQFKGKSIEPQQKSVVRAVPIGMQTLGKAVAARRMPPPTNLPPMAKSGDSASLTADLTDHSTQTGQSISLTAAAVVSGGSVLSSSAGQGSEQNRGQSTGQPRGPSSSAKWDQNDFPKLDEALQQPQNPSPVVANKANRQFSNIQQPSPSTTPPVSVTVTSTANLASLNQQSSDSLTAAEQANSSSQQQSATGPILKPANLGNWSMPTNRASANNDSAETLTSDGQEAPRQTQQQSQTGYYHNSQQQPPASGSYPQYRNQHQQSQSSYQGARDQYMGGNNSGGGGFNRNSSRNQQNYRQYSNNSSSYQNYHSAQHQQNNPDSGAYTVPSILKEHQFNHIDELLVNQPNSSQPYQRPQIYNVNDQLLASDNTAMSNIDAGGDEQNWAYISENVDYNEKITFSDDLDDDLPPSQEDQTAKKNTGIAAEPSQQVQHAQGGVTTMMNADDEGLWDQKRKQNEDEVKKSIERARQRRAEEERRMDEQRRAVCEEKLRQLNEKKKRAAAGQAGDQTPVTPEPEQQQQAPPVSHSPSLSSTSNSSAPGPWNQNQNRQQHPSSQIPVPGVSIRPPPSEPKFSATQQKYQQRDGQRQQHHQQEQQQYQSNRSRQTKNYDFDDASYDNYGPDDAGQEGDSYRSHLNGRQQRHTNAPQYAEKRPSKHTENMGRGGRGHNSSVGQNNSSAPYQRYGSINNTLTTGHNRNNEGDDEQYGYYYATANFDQSRSSKAYAKESSGKLESASQPVVPMGSINAQTSKSQQASSNKAKTQQTVQLLTKPAVSSEGASPTANPTTRKEQIQSSANQVTVSTNTGNSVHNNQVPALRGAQNQSSKTPTSNKLQQFAGSKENNQQSRNTRYPENNTRNMLRRRHDDPYDYEDDRYSNGDFYDQQHQYQNYRSSGQRDSGRYGIGQDFYKKEDEYDDDYSDYDDEDYEEDEKQGNKNAMSRRAGAVQIDRKRSFKSSLTSRGAGGQRPVNDSANTIDYGNSQRSTKRGSGRQELRGGLTRLRKTSLTYSGGARPLNQNTFSNSRYRSNEHTSTSNRNTTNNRSNQQRDVNAGVASVTNNPTTASMTTTASPQAAPAQPLKPAAQRQVLKSSNRSTKSAETDTVKSGADVNTEEWETASDTSQTKHQLKQQRQSIENFVASPRKISNPNRSTRRRERNVKDDAYGDEEEEASRRASNRGAYSSSRGGYHSDRGLVSSKNSYSQGGRPAQYNDNGSYYEDSSKSRNLSKRISNSQQSSNKSKEDQNMRYTAEYWTSSSTTKDANSNTAANTAGTTSADTRRSSNGKSANQSNRNKFGRSQRGGVHQGSNENSSSRHASTSNRGGAGGNNAAGTSSHIRHENSHQTSNKPVVKVQVYRIDNIIADNPQAIKDALTKATKTQGPPKSAGIEGIDLNNYAGVAIVDYVAESIKNDDGTKSGDADDETNDDDDADGFQQVMTKRDKKAEKLKAAAAAAQAAIVAAKKAQRGGRNPSVSGTKSAANKQNTGTKAQSAMVNSAQPLNTASVAASKVSEETKNTSAPSSDTQPQAVIAAVKSAVSTAPSSGMLPDNFMSQSSTQAPVQQVVGGKNVMTNIQTWNNEIADKQSTNSKKSQGDKEQPAVVKQASTEGKGLVKLGAEANASGPLSPSVDLNLKIESCKKVWDLSVNTNNLPADFIDKTSPQSNATCPTAPIAVKLGPDQKHTESDASSIAVLPLNGSIATGNKNICTVKPTQQQHHSPRQVAQQQASSQAQTSQSQSQQQIYYDNNMLINQAAATASSAAATAAAAAAAVAVAATSLSSMQQITVAPAVENSSAVDSSTATSAVTDVKASTALPSSMSISDLAKSGPVAASASSRQLANAGGPVPPSTNQPMPNMAAPMLTMPPQMLQNQNQSHSHILGAQQLNIQMPIQQQQPQYHQPYSSSSAYLNNSNNLVNSGSSAFTPNAYGVGLSSSSPSATISNSLLNNVTNSFNTMPPFNQQSKQFANLYQNQPNPNRGQVNNNNKGPSGMLTNFLFDIETAQQQQPHDMTAFYQQQLNMAGYNPHLNPNPNLALISQQQSQYSQFPQQQQMGPNNMSRPPTASDQQHQPQIPFVGGSGKGQQLVNKPQQGMPSQQSSFQMAPGSNNNFPNPQMSKQQHFVGPNFMNQSHYQQMAAISQNQDMLHNSFNSFSSNLANQNNSNFFQGNLLVNNFQQQQLKNSLFGAGHSNSIGSQQQQGFGMQQSRPQNQQTSQASSSSMNKHGQVESATNDFFNSSTIPNSDNSNNFIMSVAGAANPSGVLNNSRNNFNAMKTLNNQQQQGNKNFDNQNNNYANNNMFGMGMGMNPNQMMNQFTGSSNVYPSQAMATGAYMNQSSNTNRMNDKTSMSQKTFNNLPGGNNNNAQQSLEPHQASLLGSHSQKFSNNGQSSFMFNQGQALLPNPPQQIQMVEPSFDQSSKQVQGRFNYQRRGPSQSTASINMQQQVGLNKFNKLPLSTTANKPSSGAAPTQLISPGQGSQPVLSQSELSPGKTASSNPMQSPGSSSSAKDQTLAP